MIIAVSGVDGSGKSTVVMTLAAKLRSKGAVTVVHAGKPQTALVEKARSILRSPSKRREGKDRERQRERNRVLRDAMPALVLAFMRLHLCRKARRFASKGSIVVADRWPTVQCGLMDGPRISYANAGVWRHLLRMLAALERGIYKRMEPADIVFVLTVSIDTAIARNEARVKTGKESRADIIRRHHENMNFTPIARQCCYLCNDGSLEEIVLQIETLIEKCSAGALSELR